MESVIKPQDQDPLKCGAWIRHLRVVVLGIPMLQISAQLRACRVLTSSLTTNNASERLRHEVEIPPYDTTGRKIPALRNLANMMMSVTSQELLLPTVR